MKNNNVTKEEFDTLLLRANAAYHSWESKLYCPAFNTFIQITRSGWNHIVKSKDREKKELIFRLRYLHLVPVVIKKTTTIQRETIHYKKCGVVKIWSFIAIESMSTVEVVIRQIANQPRHLFSFIYKGASPKRIRHKEKVVSSLRG